MTDTKYMQDFKIRLDAMKSVLSALDGTIANAEAKEYFLSAPKNHLRECEVFLADSTNQTVGIAGFALTLAEQQLVAVQKLVSKYGPNIKIVGG